MNLSSARVIVLTPVFEDVAVFEMLLRELSVTVPEGLCVVAVDDGSVLHPLTTQVHEKCAVAGVVVTLKRNIGHQRAISVALRCIAPHIHAGQKLVVMDSDGEDVPADVQTLLSALGTAPLDVVVAKRANRAEGLVFRTSYYVYKLLFRTLTGRPIAFGNFMAMHDGAARRLACMPELDLHLAATVLASKLRVGHCALDRGARYAGQSKMNFVTLTLHGFRALMVFTEDVLVRVSLACVLIAGMSVLLALIAVGLKLTGYSSPGWFSVALGVLVLIFLQTGTISLMTLLLTGVSRGKLAVHPEDHLMLVERTAEAR
jgi:hypothetical protein